jgi:hypothetical protein
MFVSIAMEVSLVSKNAVSRGTMRQTKFHIYVSYETIKVMTKTQKQNLSKHTALQSDTAVRVN